MVDDTYFPAISNGGAGRLRQAERGEALIAQQIREQLARSAGGCACYSVTHVIEEDIHLPTQRENRENNKTGNAGDQ